MIFTPLLNFTLPILNNVLICGVPITIALFFVVCAIEAYLLRRLIPEIHAVKDSFLMNLVTTLLGWLPILLPAIEATYFPNLLLWIPVGWLISMGVEGGVLKLLERNVPVQLWVKFPLRLQIIRKRWRAARG